MKTRLFTLILFIFSVNVSSAQNDKKYIFISNGSNADNVFDGIESDLNGSEKVELYSLGDNEISLLQDLSQNCTDCKVTTVIGDKDIEHQFHPVLESFKFKKRTICPDPIVKELDKNQVMIILNSNWFIDREYKFSAQNNDCDFLNEIHLLEELEDKLEDYKDWNKIIIAHHGVESISEISGRGMGLKNFIPFYGQLYLSFRKNIGFDQDLTSIEYQKYISFLSKITSKFDKLCILSGHDYLNHVIDDKYVTHINVNSSKNHFRYSKNEQTAFVSEEANYLSLKKYGDQWKFEFISKSGTTEVKNVFKSRTIQEEPKSEPNKSNVPIKSAVKASTKYEANALTHCIMGKGYRSEWSEPVAASLLDITTYDGGLIPYAIGGGLQTMSIKFKSNNGRKYAFRVLDKEPEKSLSDIARESIYRVIVQEMITTMHPYGPLVANKLLDATDIIHIKPELFILKPNSSLDDIYQPFVGKIGTLEEKPSGKKNGIDGFYGADKVVSSFEMMVSLRKSHRNTLDPMAYAKARLMDMFLGDWDRHEDNWKWAMFKEDNNKIYRPIPKDRDHVFSKWHGIVPSVADMVISNAEDFDDQYGNLRHLNFKARFLDRELAGHIDLDTWLEAVSYLQEKLTDEVIEEAVHTMPKEVFHFHGEEIIRKLKSRREDLTRAIKEYYEELNEHAYIKGSNKSDHFEITRLDDGRVQIVIYDLTKDGEKGEQYLSRTLDPNVVKKIYCFGLDGDDQFNVSGDVKQSIKLRIIGGSDKDQILDLSNVKGRGRLTQVYDSSNEDIITPSTETVIKRPSRPAQYDPYSFDYNWLIPNITLRTSSGNGFGFGGGATYLIRGFNKPGFAKKWTFGGVYYPQLKAHRIEAGFTFRHFIGLSDIKLRSRYSTLYDRYPFFYGIGNDTKVIRDRRRKLNRIDYDFFDFEAGLETTFAHKSKWSNSILFENHKVENRDNIGAIDTLTKGYGEASFVALKTKLELDFTNNSLYPENGTQFDLLLEGRTNLEGDLTGNMNTRFSIFKTYDLGLRTTFIGSIHYKHSFGAPAFYHLSRLGSQTQFRGYTRNRFIDKYALLYNSEVRILLGTIKTPLIRFVVGVFGFYDGGRVWNKSSEFYEGEWNNSYGGGIFFAPGSKDYTISLLMARPEDNFTYSKLQIGFDF